MYARTLGREAKRRVALSVFVLVVSLVAAGCGGSSGSSGSSGGGAGSNTSDSFLTGPTPGGTPVRGGTAVIDSPEAPKSLDPISEAGGPAFQRGVTTMFDTLAETMQGSPEPQPALAKSWTISSNNLVYTFHIRPGVKFSNGEPLTAEDVVYTLRRDQTSPISSGAFFTKKWKSVSITTPLTVQIRLTRPEPLLIEALAFPFFAIMDKHVIAGKPESWIAQHPIGTGPFMLKSTTSGYATVNLVRNPYYWRTGLPYLNSLVLNQVESESARILAVRSGSATIAASIPYSQVGTLKETPGVRMLVEPEWGNSINPINDTKPPLNEPNVRRALIYATPSQAIIKAVYKGYGTQANSVGTGLMKYWDSSLAVYPYDIAKAKAVLKSTSVPNGFPITIQVQGGESAGEAVASILQSSWAKIGVHVSIHAVDATTLFANLFAGKFEFIVNPPENGDQEAYDAGISYYIYLGDTFFPAEVPSVRMKSEIEKLNLTVAPSERQALIKRLQYQSYWQEPTWIPIINLVSLNLVSDAVRGLNVLPNSQIRPEEIWLAH